MSWKLLDAFLRITRIERSRRKTVCTSTGEQSMVDKVPLGIFEVNYPVSNSYHNVDSLEPLCLPLIGFFMCFWIFHCVSTRPKFLK